MMSTAWRWGFLFVPPFFELGLNVTSSVVSDEETAHAAIAPPRSQDADQDAYEVLSTHLLLLRW